MWRGNDPAVPNGRKVGPLRSCFRGRACGRWFACLSVLLAPGVSLRNRAVCADQILSEYQVKAAYVFNLLKFVEWPGDSAVDPRGKWVIGIIGESPVGGELTRLVEGRNVLGRALQVRKFQVADDLRGCHILFISKSAKKQLPSILAAVSRSSVLTVADMDNFIGSGGMVQLVVEGTRVRITIDIGATGRAGLRVSSKLLALAQAVTETARSAHN